jgi:hypothetical protein
MIQDNLQQIVDGMRDELRKGDGGYWVVRDSRIPSPGFA